MGVHVDVQRWLRYAKPEVRPPVSDVHARKRSRRDEEHVSNFVCQLVDVGEVSTLMSRDALNGDRDINQEAGNDHW